MFDPGILIGDILTESDVHSIFECQTQLGIRLSRKNNAIVIVSDATSNNVYADVWDGDILYYTGTNAGSVNGNQTLSGPGNNNGALKAVWEKPDATTIFLFIKYAANQCTYKGVVKLAKEPYQEARKSNPSQQVWKFPLQLVNVGVEKLHRDYAIVEGRSCFKSEEELKQTIAKKVKNPNRVKPIKRTASANVYDRDPEISAYIKARACGKCDLCGSNAPFTDENGQPYFESHHITWLSRGGSDIPENMVALCPNCHRKVHVLDSESDRKQLESRINYYMVRKQ